MGTERCGCCLRGQNTNVAMADLIAAVKVKNDGKEFSYIMGEDIPERFQFTVTDTRYTFEIEDVWYGEVKKKSIPVVLAGGKESGCTIPHKNDLLVVFLAKRDIYSC